MISAASHRLAVLLGVIAPLTACGGASVSTPGAADVGDAVRVPVEGGGSYTDITPAQGPDQATRVERPSGNAP